MAWENIFACSSFHMYVEICRNDPHDNTLKKICWCFRNYKTIFTVLWSGHHYSFFKEDILSSRIFSIEKLLRRWSWFFSFVWIAMSSWGMIVKWISVTFSQTGCCRQLKNRVYHVTQLLNEVGEVILFKGMSAKVNEPLRQLHM